MNCIQERLAKHRVATYCIVTFALTWAFWFAAVYPRALPLMEAGKSIFSDSLTVMLVGAGMFFPALGVVVTRLITGEGFHNVWIKPVQLLYGRLAWPDRFGCSRGRSVFPLESEPVRSFDVAVR